MPAMAQPLCKLVLLSPVLAEKVETAGVVAMQ